jgi:5-methylcytosine-specific restriction endonuclease McrA
MPRKPDVPCAVCGNLMWGGSGSLPPGEATRRSCRRLERRPYGRRDGTPIEKRPCAYCDELFWPQDASGRDYVQLTCSRACSLRMRGAHVTTSLTTPEEKRLARLERWRRKNRKRRGPDIISEPYTLAEIAARDGYRCGLCRRKVNMALKNPHPQAPTIDHVIPLSISRDDTRVNVQLAHRGCNVAKGVRAVGEQLALIG